MSDERLDAIEARLGALEGAVRGLGGNLVPKRAPEPPAAADLATVSVAVPAPEPVASPSPEPAASPSPGDLEAMIAGRGLQIAGFVLVLLGAAFFLDLAFTRGWIGPAERIALGLAAGSGLIAFSAMRLRGAYRTLGESLIGLGAGIDYLSIWAAAQVYPDLHVSHGVAFVAMMAVTGALGALAAARRSQATALFGALGGFLTPVLLAGGEPERVILAAYLAVLASGLLVLARRSNFAAVEVTTMLGVLAYAGTFAPNPMEGWAQLDAQIVAAGFAVLLGIGFTLGPAVDGGALKRRVALLVVDAGAYIVSLYAIFGGDERMVGYQLLGFAALLLVLARMPRLAPVLARTYGYVGLAAVTLSLPALFSAASLVDALTIESLLLFGLGRRGDVRLARAGTALLGLIAFSVLSATWLEHPDPSIGLYVELALWLASAGIVLNRFWELQLPDESALLGGLARVGFDVVALSSLTRVCLDLFAPHADVYALTSSAEFVISFAWTAFAAMLFVFGLRARRPLLRWEAISLFAATILKVFSVDLSSVDVEWRIGSFVVLGSVLFAVSAAYTRMIKKPSTGGAE